MREIFDIYSYLKISGAQAGGRRLKAREAGIHVPVFLQADISVHCNLSCPGCENGYIHTKHQEELMTVNEWDVLFREAEKLGIRFFFLTGGEGDPGAGGPVSEQLVSGFHEGNASE